MKAITFEGKQYKVEDWVKWVARDSDGDVVVFDQKPVIFYGEFWACVGGCLHKTIYPINPCNWQDSLTEV